jgi:hypothetical protein
MISLKVERKIGDAVREYRNVKKIVISKGYKEEIERLATRKLEDITEQIFLYEMAYVVLESGFNSSVVRKLSSRIDAAFYNFESAAKISEHKEEVYTNALKAFGNKSKIRAIIKNAEKVNKLGWKHVKVAIQINPIDSLRMFQYIGPVTVNHLAKYLGYDVAKHDRHLVRIAHGYGYASGDDNNDVQNLCQDISQQTGDSIPIVDSFWWYYAALVDKDYKNTLRLPL